MKEISTIPQLLEEVKNNKPICPRCGGRIQFISYYTNAIMRANTSQELDLTFECLRCNSPYRAHFTRVPSIISDELVWVKDNIELTEDNFTL